MSFLSVLTKIGDGLHAGTAIASPLLPILNLIPGFGPNSILSKGITIVISVEGIFTDAKQGIVKRESAVVLLAKVFPKADVVTLGEFVDHIVALLNLAAKLTPATP